MRVDLEPPQHGWMIVRLASDGEEVTIDASYVTDWLRELVDAVHAFLAYGTDQAVEIQLEPDVVRLELFGRATGTDGDDGPVECVVSELPGRPLGAPRVVARFVTTRRDLALAFWRGLRRLSTSFDERHWSTPFPANHLDALTRLIKAPR